MVSKQNNRPHLFSYENHKKWLTSKIIDHICSATKTMEMVNKQNNRPHLFSYENHRKWLTSKIIDHICSATKTMANG